MQAIATPTGSDVAPSEEPKKPVKWSYDNEEIIAVWADQGKCLAWMYHRTHKYYANLNAWYTIPAIIFSTISGTASFAQASLPVEYQVYAPMLIGTINIVIGILTTIQQYLKIGELKESNKILAVAWDKFARNIAIELAKAPDERLDAGHFLKFSRQEFDRLMESGNAIPSHILRKFKTRFRGKTPEEKENYDMINKPDVCDVIVSINANRHMWFTRRNDFYEPDDDHDHKRRHTADDGDHHDDYNDDNSSFPELPTPRDSIYKKRQQNLQKHRMAVEKKHCRPDHTPRAKEKSEWDRFTGVQHRETTKPNHMMSDILQYVSGSNTHTKPPLNLVNLTDVVSDVAAAAAVIHPEDIEEGIRLEIVEPLTPSSDDLSYVDELAAQYDHT